jgi:UPF0755 protein
MSERTGNAAARVALRRGTAPPHTPPAAPATALATALLLVLGACRPPAPADPLTVTIPRGASFDDAIDSLVTRGIVTRPGFFRIYARLQGVPGNLKSGVYRFSPGERWPLLVEALRSGRGVEIRFTAREGLMLFEVAEVAATAVGFEGEAFLAATRDERLRQELGIPADAESVEGYLFPTTYTVAVGTRPTDLVRVMTREFESRWKPEWNARLDSLGMSRHELVTLASIIQAEMRYGPDAEYISAVYHNRLRRRMPLQADPTVIYAHGRRLRRVYEKHLDVGSPYNTYRNRGLPPGPISQPGLAALRAALYPADAPYLYFVARWDGKHVFSETYRQHVAAIREIRRGRRR